VPVPGVPHRMLAHHQPDEALPALPLRWNGYGVEGGRSQPLYPIHLLPPAPGVGAGCAGYGDADHPRLAPRHRPIDPCVVTPGAREQEELPPGMTAGDQVDQRRGPRGRCHP
jgi:hypothetical protein